MLIILIFTIDLTLIFNNYDYINLIKENLYDKTN